MDTSRNDLLGEIAADAALERSDFLAAAAAQLRRFLDANGPRIDELGGLVLIDDDVDYLAIAPDLTFRSRTRYQDETGKWVSETEVIESASELVELYNLADVFAAFSEATKIGAGLRPEPTATPDLLATADIADTDTVSLGGENPYAAAADDWAATQDEEEAPPQDEEEAAQRLYDLALAFQERSQQTEAHLIEQFETASSRLTAVLGDLIVVDDEDERLTLQASGSFVAEVIPESEEGTGEWRRLGSADELVEFYDPTDVFGDLADALAEGFPNVAPEEGGAAEEGEADESESDGEGEDEGDEDEFDEEDAEDGEPGPEDANRP